MALYAVTIATPQRNNSHQFYHDFRPVFNPSSLPASICEVSQLLPLPDGISTQINAHFELWGSFIFKHPIHLGILARLESGKRMNMDSMARIAASAHCCSSSSFTFHEVVKS